MKARNSPDDDCKLCDAKIQLSFCSNGSFYQELVDLLGSQGQFAPASNTNSSQVTAQFQLRFSHDFSKIRYRLYVFDATELDNKIISAHIHYGAANVNGPVLVTLYAGSPTNVSGLLSKGTIRNSDITHYNGGTNPLNQINSIASIYAAIRLGNIYFNVHSQKFPAGIARGQIYSSDA